MAGESVAGRSGSRAGNKMCEVMIAASPAASAARNGTSSTASNAGAVVRDARQGVVRVGVRVAVAGKVLAAGQNARILLKPAHGRRAQRGDEQGSSPYARSPMTGLCGLLLTSRTGAKSQLKPSRSALRPSREPQRGPAPGPALCPTSRADGRWADSAAGRAAGRAPLPGPRPQTAAAGPSLVPGFAVRQWSRGSGRAGRRCGPSRSRRRRRTRPQARRRGR